MVERPLLIFPEIRITERDKKGNQRGKEKYRCPDFQGRKDRLTPQFESMMRCFITDSTQGIEPEYVLVLETLGRIEDFERAIRAIKGLEWLAEIDTDEIESDNQYYQIPNIKKRLFSTKIPHFAEHQSKKIWEELKKHQFIDKGGCLINEDVEAFRDFIPEEFFEYEEDIIKALNSTIFEFKTSGISGRLFLSMSNRRAMEELIKLWNGWDEQDKRFTRGYTKWKEIFSQLKNLRRWDTRDRVRDTGVEKYWQEEFNIKKGTASKIPFEIELWYRKDQNKRKQVQEEIEKLIRSERGNVIAASVIDEIRFHAVKAELPPESIEKVLNHQFTRLFRHDSIMFFRSMGQWTIQTYTESEVGKFEKGTVSGEPVAAIFDGYPFANHSLLQDRLIIDDPDDYERDYLAGERQHGTAMASLICHGELDANEPPLSNPVYFRPIMKPNLNFPTSPRPEHIPDEVFMEDIIERSVRRLFEGEGSEPPAAPTIKVINFSIGDSTKMFFNQLSSAARLLDWLSYKYQVLFCVSAGNIQGEIDLKKNDIELKELSNDELPRYTMKFMHDNNRNRRIFSPADSINALTVGALHSDHSKPDQLGNRIDILPSRLLPSPISTNGHGFRSSIKPEIYIPGGKQLYYNKKGSTVYFLSDDRSPPGQKAAAAARSPGDTNRYVYLRGTSNAAALATRGAARISEVLKELKEKYNYDIPEENTAALIKTLLVHSASWGNSTGIFEKIFTDVINKQQLRKRISRYFGFGVPDIGRVLECTSRRATAIGSGVIQKDEKHEFRLPLPPSLNDFREIRRLIVTLAWFSPINPDNRKLRKASLSFDPKNKVNIGVERKEADWHQVKNGTVQHEIFDGNRAVSFQDGDSLVIPVICKEDAGGLDDEIHYGFAVTLEVSEKIDIPLYEEIKERIRIPIRIEE